MTEFDGEISGLVHAHHSCVAEILNGRPGDRIVGRSIRGECSKGALHTGKIIDLVRSDDKTKLYTEWIVGSGSGCIQQPPSFWFEEAVDWKDTRDGSEREYAIPVVRPGLAHPAGPDEGMDGPIVKLVVGQAIPALGGWRGLKHGDVVYNARWSQPRVVMMLGGRPDRMLLERWCESGKTVLLAEMP